MLIKNSQQSIKPAKHSLKFNVFNCDCEAWASASASASASVVVLSTTPCPGCLATAIQQEL